ncbi:adenylate/guanylate cyclase domain-containing protein [Rhodopseudomonas palustris]|uniref:adenylate/guanylate cyclase domain-containing protein n=1 Tax=Rhodopseudomonas palustris TaxID=1076 RepID=UPI000CECC151|nr:adenylate/guanylate cyclase domain-containing protein [Rhodopseudomonas palustris]PPQ43973.1 adenylate/guanylate cyclase domain-containing protein [Rhodopseudomonas palustris]QLH70682.1 adenylate/guanylate cyclase domain-containing protein [Rhodopseudomonas palustris]RIA02449.1 adenylate/guanylate cyclase domain-containing protein [Rhodopseudomonas palustris]
MATRAKPNKKQNASARGKKPAWLGGIGLRQVRMFCGLVLFTYLLSHFLNHALGNISPEALHAGVLWHLEIWQFLPVAILFYGSVTVHAGLGLWALYQRRQFRWKTLEPLQLVLGLSVPLMIYSHVIVMRLGNVLYDQDRLYPQVLYNYFVASPSYRAWLMVAVMLIAWTHGCIGLYVWLRIKPAFRRAMPWLLAAAVLIPTLALLGFYQGGRTVAREAASPQWQANNLAPANLGTPEQQQTLEAIGNGFLIFYLGLIALALIARAVRAIIERRGGMVRLTYDGERSIRVPKGLTVLEATQRHNIPHASACGGRARCSTCRIRVLGDPAMLPPPSPREAFVLASIGTGDDPSIRLACQLKPTQDLTFLPVFPPRNVAAARKAARAARIGEERYLVSMFVDMRGSTKLAESRLPFDTVFIVNRFLGAVSRSVIACGGQPNQFVGDGMLALFGLAETPREACRNAVRAAAAIGAAIDELNNFLGHDLPEPIRFGIGIHSGEVVVGEIGYRDHMVFTALGDSVNVASRLQDMTKSLGCETLLSDELRATAGLSEQALPTLELEIRGRTEPMLVCVVERAGDLVAVLNEDLVLA